MIRLLPLRFTFAPTRALRLPAYPGALWRGALGARLRADVCITGASTCSGCRVRSRCAYGRVFEPDSNATSEGLNARFRELPRPYVMSAEHTGGEISAGEPISVILTLIGAGIRDVIAVRRAASRIELNRTRMRLLGAAVVPPGQHPAFDPGTLSTLHGYQPEPPRAPPRVRVVLEHPLRLRKNGRYIDPESFSFATFTTALLRRISSLRAGSADEPLSADYAALKAHAQTCVTIEDSWLSWYEWHRWSARQRRPVPMGGLVGAFTVGGDLEALWPWLWTGQWTHLGKGAVMGLGRYRLEVSG